MIEISDLFLMVDFTILISWLLKAKMLSSKGASIQLGKNALQELSETFFGIKKSFLV